jgi:transcription initiation factor TFIIB
MATRDIYATGFDEDIYTESSANQCPECHGHVTTNVKETVCEDCGLVIEEQRLDHGPEWRACDADERERTGAPLTTARHDRGLSTEIGHGTDVHGNELSGQKRRRLARMRREQTRGRWRSKAERNLTHGLGEVRRLASALELSESLRDQACQLFRSAQSEDLLRGRSIEAIGAASIYGTCRCNQHPLLLEDVVDAARVESTRVTNTYRTLNRELELPAPPMRPTSFISRLISALELDHDIRRRANKLAERAEGTTLANGCQPSGVAAACVYLAAQEQGALITQATVASAAEVSVVTLRSRRDELQAI